MKDRYLLEPVEDVGSESVEGESARNRRRVEHQDARDVHVHDAVLHIQEGSVRGRESFHVHSVSPALERHPTDSTYSAGDVPRGQRQPESGVDAPVDTAARSASSASVNSRDLIRNRTPSGASSEKPPPRPATTSRVRWVCFQYSNCSALM